MIKGSITLDGRPISMKREWKGDHEEITIILDPPVHVRINEQGLWEEVGKGVTPMSEEIGCALQNLDKM